MSQGKDLDLSKHVIIQRHDNSVYAIPIERLEEFKVDDASAEMLKKKTGKADLQKQQKPFTGDLVAGPGCYRG